MNHQMSKKIYRAGRRLAAVLCLAVLSMAPATLAAQGESVRGQVCDQYNNPVGGVTITVNGSSATYTTQPDGSFEFPWNRGDVLVFSHEKFLTKKVKLGKQGKLAFSVHLTGRFRDTDKVVPGPYGVNTSSEAYLGSAATVYTNDLDKYLAPNIITGLHGRMAGFNISQYRGFSLHQTASNTSSALIGNIPASFGVGAFSDNTQFALSARGQSPVVIIDGVERELFSLDPEAIESVSLQKDALSSMFLGMRSSRGALIITTKNPSKGALHLSLTGKFGFHSSVTKLHPLKASTYAYLLNEALQNDGLSALYSYSDYQAYANGTDAYGHPDVDWSDQLLKKQAVSQSYNMNVSGGGDVAQYFVSLGYLNEQGLFKTDSGNGYNTNLSLNRYMISSKVNINITDDFTATMTALGRVEEGNQPGGSGSGYSDLLRTIYTTPNNAYPVYNPDGSYGGNESFQNNLLSQTVNSGYISDNARDIMASLRLKYDFGKLVEGLSARLYGSVANQSRTSITRTKRTPVFSYRLDDNGNPAYSQYGTPQEQSNDFRDVSSYRYLYGQLAVDYERQFGMHGFKASLMGDTRHELDDYDLPMIPSNVMESASYNYAQRYFAQMAVTESYYNRYAPSHRWGSFYAVGLGWDIAREPFMENVGWMNQLKIRATYGKTGSGISNSGYFSWRQTYTDTYGYYVMGSSQSAPSYVFARENGIANPYVTWEKAHKFNIGLDAAVLDKRLTLSFDYYNDKYYDLLQSRGKSIELFGASYPAENIGKARRYGAELTLSWEDHIGDFNYYLSGNWSLEQSKLLYKDEQKVAYDWLRQTGHPLGSIWGLVADGFLSSEDIANNYPVINGYSNIQPGDVKYKDLNQDGVIDEFDRKIIGGDKPIGYFGVDLGLEWKGLEFSMLWQGSYNRDMYISDATLTQGFQSIGQLYGQAYENILNRWTPETAATATYPRLSAGGNNYNAGNGWGSSMWLKSGNYIRLKNISLGYNLPESFCRNCLGGVRVKVFLNGQNLLTMSACDLVDPEVSFTSSPLQRCIFTGINLNF